MDKLPDDEMRDRYGTYRPKPVPDLRDNRIADLERRLAESEAMRIEIEAAAEAAQGTLARRLAESEAVLNGELAMDAPLLQQCMLTIAHCDEKPGPDGLCNCAKWIGHRLVAARRKAGKAEKRLAESKAACGAMVPSGDWTRAMLRANVAESACAEMKLALEFYSDTANYEAPDPDEYGRGSLAVVLDNGDRARTAISTDAGRLAARPTLFRLGEVALHSGGSSNFKLDCDALTDADWSCLAALVAKRIQFGDVVGVPTGGIRWASALAAYATSGPTLIVDDVLTTGGSMEKMREQCPDAIGVVLFARGTCPDWVAPVFQMWPAAAAEVLAAAERLSDANARAQAAFLSPHMWGYDDDAEGPELIRKREHATRDVIAAVEAWRKGGAGGQGNADA